MHTHFDLKRHIPLKPYSVPLIIWDVIENFWTDRNVRFTESFPREDAVTGPVIAWKVYRRITGRDGLETLKPRLRGQYTDPQEPTITREQWAQWQTIIFQFDIYDINNQAVNTLTEDFDDLMYHITPVLKNFGVNEWLFDEQLIDVETQRESSQEVYKRTLRYRCILERKFFKAIPTIQQIWLKATGATQTVLNEKILRSSESAKDTLANKWAQYIHAVDAIPITTLSYTSSGYYQQDVDFTLSVNLTTGLSTIDWITGAKHPSPGESYYVTYAYGIDEPAVLVDTPARITRAQS